mgnify:CR=1 FL=1
MQATAKPASKRKATKWVRVAVPVDLHADLLRMKINRDEPLYTILIDTLAAGVKAIHAESASA